MYTLTFPTGYDILENFIPTVSDELQAHMTVIGKVVHIRQKLADMSKKDFDAIKAAQSIEVGAELEHTVRYLYTLYYKGTNTPGHLPLVNLSTQLIRAGVAEYHYSLPIHHPCGTMFGCNTENFDTVKELLAEAGMSNLLIGYDNYSPVKG